MAAALAAMGLDRTILEYNLRLFANSLMAHLAIVIEGGRLTVTSIIKPTRTRFSPRAYDC